MTSQQHFFSKSKVEKFLQMKHFRNINKLFAKHNTITMWIQKKNTHRNYCCVLALAVVIACNNMFCAHILHINLSGERENEKKKKTFFSTSLMVLLKPPFLPTK